MADSPIGIVTLSTAGVVTTPNEKIDFAMAYFFETQPSQSNETRQHNVSCQELLMKYGNDSTTLSNEMQNRLNEYLKRFFKSSSIEVLIDDPDSGGAYNVIIRGSVTEADGKKYQIAESLEAHGESFKRIMKLNNG